MSKLADDPRIDPRIKAVFGAFDPKIAPDFATRDDLLAYETTETAQASAETFRRFRATMGGDHIETPEGLRTETLEFASAPDGNRIKIQFIRPDTDECVPCVFHIHGGGMASGSCFEATYTTFARMIAKGGVAVAMVDFRNSVRPSSAIEVAPYPAGLNDCVSGIKWVWDNAGLLNIDCERIVVAGESGGGNLVLASGMKMLRDGDIGRIAGLYALCPFIAGLWPHPDCPSSIENEGLFLSLHDNRYYALAYGIEHHRDRNPLAWPIFATADDIRGLPPVVISVNECDPLRDEGVNFFRLLLNNGVPARCRQVMATVHATEVYTAVCPDISRSTAEDIAGFARHLDRR
ncbi:MAG: esterase [Sphingomonadales bacterium]|nr:esterase [Sphingomonadales bacterium]